MKAKGPRPLHNPGPASLRCQPSLQPRPWPSHSGASSAELPKPPDLQCTLTRNSPPQVLFLETLVCSSQPSSNLTSFDSPTPPHPRAHTSAQKGSTGWFKSQDSELGCLGSDPDPTLASCCLSFPLLTCELRVMRAIIPGVCCD